MVMERRDCRDLHVSRIEFQTRDHRGPRWDWNRCSLTGNTRYSVSGGRASRAWADPRPHTAWPLPRCGPSTRGWDTSINFTQTRHYTTN